MRGSGWRVPSGGLSRRWSQYVSWQRWSHSALCRWSLETEMICDSHPKLGIYLYVMYNTTITSLFISLKRRCNVAIIILSLHNIYQLGVILRHWDTEMGAHLPQATRSETIFFHIWEHRVTMKMALHAKVFCSHISYVYPRKLHVTIMIIVTPYARHGFWNQWYLDYLLNTCSYFRVTTKVRNTGPLWGESIGRRWIPLTKGQ